MTNEIQVDDSSVEGFTNPAKDRLRQATKEYLADLTAECYRIEAGVNNSGGPVEITQDMVNDAVVFRRRTPALKKGRHWRIIIRVASSILPLLVGFFFTKENVLQGSNLIFFGILLSVTVAVTTASVIMDT